MDLDYKCKSAVLNINILRSMIMHLPLHILEEKTRWVNFVNLFKCPILQTTLFGNFTLGREQ